MRKRNPNSEFSLEPKRKRERQTRSPVSPRITDLFIQWTEAQRQDDSEVCDQLAASLRQSGYEPREVHGLGGMRSFALRRVQDK